MNDNDIIKALRCCADKGCDFCSEKGKAYCRESIAALAWDLIQRQKAEIERFSDIGKLYSEIRAEAIKEFAERLCKDRVSNDPVVIAVKCEIKEMGVDL